MVQLAELVGILNVTPDSFSGDGVGADADLASEVALSLLSQGAARLDIGAESTRPDATLLSSEVEWARLEPVLDRLLDRVPDLRWSIDTRHGETARKAVARGAAWVNDVSGGSDPGLREVIAESDAELVLMHSLSVPPDRAHRLPSDADPCELLATWAEERLQQLGLPRERVIFDPGIGFGKSPAQSMAILSNLGRLRRLGVRLLVGHSRKSWLTVFNPPEGAVRDVETVAVSMLVAPAADYLRVHDVGMHARALAVLRQWPAPAAEMSLHGVALQVNLGWTDEERGTPQPVAVDFTVRYAEKPAACTTDDLRAAVDYAALARTTRRLVAGQSYRLVEHLAQAIYTGLRADLPPGATLRVCVAKLHPPMRDVSGAATFACGDFV